MTESLENVVPTNPEADHSTRTAWLFDVDGVVTNPESKSVKRPEIIDFIAERLEKGDPVALVTGRALPWVMERVVPFIKERTKENPILLNNFYVSGEFGGAYTVWNDGAETHLVDPTIRVPEEIILEAKEEAKRYQTSHFVDPDKETMVSLEMNDGMAVADFKPPQLELADKLTGIVKKYGKDDQFEVHVDRIATNIRDRRANKFHAAEQVAKWAKENGNVVLDEFITFGDSASDTEMSEQLNKMGIKTKLVFVGGKEHLEGKTFDFPVEYTAGHCDNGVVEFIDNLKSNS